VTPTEFNLNAKRMDKAKSLMNEINHAQDAIDWLNKGNYASLSVYFSSIDERSFSCGKNSDNRKDKTLRRLMITALTEYKMELEKGFAEL